jgi:hypothetical protein
VCRGEDAVDKFLQCLEKEEQDIQEKLEVIQAMQIRGRLYKKVIKVNYS